MGFLSPVKWYKRLSRLNKIYVFAALITILWSIECVVQKTYDYIHIMSFSDPNKELITQIGYDEEDIEAVYPLKLAKEEGKIFTFGPCDREPCFYLLYHGTAEEDGVPVASLGLGGNIGSVKTESPIPYMRVDIPIRKGCGAQFKSQERDIVVETIEDRVTELRGRVTVLTGTLVDSDGIGYSFIGCD